MPWSSNINGVIKEQFQASLFFYEEILDTKKMHKMQTSDFHSDIFIRVKSIKSKTSDFHSWKSTKRQTSFVLDDFKKR